MVPLVAECLTQLGGGLIITPATMPSPAAIPAFQRLVPTPYDQLATLLPTFRLALPFCDLLPGH